MSFQLALLQFMSGLSGGMLVFIIAIGLTLIFGTLKVLNLAHGSIYMLGAFMCFWIVSSFPNVPGIFWWTFIICPLVCALAGGLIDRLCLRRIYDWDVMYQYIITFGLMMIIGDLCKLFWGRGFHSINYPWPLAGSVLLAGIPFPVYNLFLIAAGVLIFFGLWSLLNFTRLGAVIRAVTFNREMAGALGKNVEKIYTFMFMLGSGLGGLAGVLVTPMSTVTLGMDVVVIIQCFIVVVIGGLGSLTGAFLGAIILGLANSFGILFFPRLAIAFGYILLAIVLIIRPYGLMGKPE